ncbi:sigma 54-interacting transcriptional regulator [Crassaminicella indica]|uniref:Sigma 54-interacting transcriptional regulator n=1 Tax=Crassaminicella indica TaxID=2855394 RepID=A0ABX8R942_9CLOT|nr:sigma 54-interacting transcriptional regulator [Crassaminicella indica]QXM05548.1 sigma 54-interacting transcriptional regulator [Crassaminicella indica]
MFKNKDYIKQFTDMMSEGFIFIDDEGKIQIYNEKAKEIFRISCHEDIGHDGGRLNLGDIVIIGDNCLGKDDGGLTPKDLTYIGIYDDKINIKDAFVGIGVYKNKDCKPIYFHKKLDEKKDDLILDTVFQNIKINVHINFIKKYIAIIVENKRFQLPYMNAIGHMVVIDKATKKVKFYQTRGYTARGESIANLLLGKSFRAKGKNVEQLDVLGKNIFDIHEGGDTIKEFYQVARGSDISYKDKFTEINGFLTLCTLLPVTIEGKRVGAALKVEDISMLKKIIKERDEALLHVEEMEKKLKEEQDTKDLFSSILGESKEMKAVKKLAYKASKTDSTVLLLGESGTGKSLLAHAIHKASNYKDQPFIHVNCGAIPEQLLESELFGYEKGAFTGARREGKAGLFEVADKGTIFLDEIGEMNLSVQVKLLKVLQNKTFFRVGGTKEKSVNVRIIAATNKNLEEEMRIGKFREDLYYRINVFPIWMPPLRERREDIYPFVQQILPKICKKLGCENKSVSGEAFYMLLEYDWPGNVRELENVLERAVNLSEGNIIKSIHLPISKKYGKKEEVKPLKEAIYDVEKKCIENALRLYNGNKIKAMKALKIGKTSFYEKLKKYNIQYKK